ncbi:hypothetical protein C8R44DRAFT_891903 [Mycena epipterygia]|nr:hypothetical protein C8R44DRAFT_891903 [Mycena epipterygia]
MDPTKATLGPETKAIHRREALKRYAEKHKTELRASAQRRMQRLRAKPPSQAQKDRQSASNTKYRKKNQAGIRAADALRRAKKGIEEGAESYEKCARHPLMAKTQRKHEHRRPSPQPQPPTVSNAICRDPHIPEESDSHSEGSTSGLEDDALIPEAIFYRSALRTRSPPLPEFICDCRLPTYCARCICACNNNLCLRHHGGESEERKWLKSLELEDQILRHQRCMETMY